MSSSLSKEFIEQAFLGEVVSQAEYCLEASAALKESLTDGSVNSCYRALHSLLAHAGNISKLLCPSLPKDKAKAATIQARASSLLSKLALPDHIIATLETRELRNHLEHFDERLDSWAATNPRILVDRNIGPLSAFGGVAPSVVLRNYDPSTSTFIFAGESYDIASLIKAVSELYEIATRVHRARWRRA
jgi:hypothetical protein